MSKIKNQKSKIKIIYQKFTAIAGSRQRREKFLILGLLLCIFMFGFWVYQGYAQNTQEAYDSPDSVPLISMDFKDASLKDVLKVLSIQSGINFIASQEIEDRTVTLYLDKVSAKEAMDKLFKANSLDYDYYEEDKIALVKKREPKVETITKVCRSHA